MKEKTLTLIVLSMLLAGGALAQAPTPLALSGPQAPSGGWATTAPMAEARAGAASVLLPDGRVLLTGGERKHALLASADFYNGDGTFSSAAPMHFARSQHTAVVLQDGRVLVAGGMTLGEGPTNSAEIYDPACDTWTIVSALAEPRAGHTATLLPDGQVLVAGGWNASGVRASLELFDPATESFRFAGKLSLPREDHTASALADGRVLIVGGTDGSAVLSSVEIFDPASGSVLSAANLSTPRAGHSATLVLDGSVLVAGGDNGAGVLASAELYDPAGDQWTATGNMAGPRRDHLAFLLPHNNNVLILGGAAENSVATAELYSPWKRGFTATGSPEAARVDPSGSPLAKDGLLLVAGGSDLSSAELYGFATVETDKDDYAAGEPVTLTGSGWAPGETVALALHEVPTTDADRFLRAKADASGNIFVDGLSTNSGEGSVTFYLTATGTASEAQARFTQTFTGSSLAPTTTTLVSTPNPSLAGEWVNFSAGVLITSPSATGDVKATDELRPTGTLTFFDGSTPLATVPLQPGAWASFNTADLTVGAHSITAHYNGDANFAPSTSPVLTQTVIRGTTDVTLVSSPNPSLGGEWVNFSAGVRVTSKSTTATLKAAELRPTGTLTFFDGSTELATMPLQPGAWASFNTPDLTVGTHSITAHYNGDANLAPSTSAVLTHTVNGGTTATTVVSTPNPSLGGQWVNFSAGVRISSNSATATLGASATAEDLRPTGTLTFFDGSTELATVPLQPGAWGSFNTPDLTVGTHSITAHYNGDTNFAPSTSPVLTHTVVLGTTATTVVSTPNPSLGGEWVNFSTGVLITSQGPTANTVQAAAELRPTGTVTFFDGATELATVALQPGSWATFNTPNLTVGSHSITVRYNGDANFAPSTSPVLTHTVALGTTSTTVASTPNPSPAGEWVNFSTGVLITSHSASAGLKAAAELRPTGTVTFFDGATELATVSLQPGSWATFNTPNLAVGSHSITVKYNGDANFAPSTSPVLTQTVQ